MRANDPADALTSFWVGRNPAHGTRLPYLLRLPIAGEGRIFLAARDDLRLDEEGGRTLEERHRRVALRGAEFFSRPQ